MIRAWIGVALLSGSWLLGLDYFFPAEPAWWLCTIAAGTGLLAGGLRRTPGRRESLFALAALLPAVWCLPWPYRIGPLLLAGGVGLCLLPRAGQKPDGPGGTAVGFLAALGRGAMLAGTVLVVQAAALSLYADRTARSHDLPSPLPEGLALVARWCGAEAAAVGPAIHIYTARQVQRLGATWELLLDPVTFCFFCGGVAAIAILAWSNAPFGRRWMTWIGWLRRFALIVAAWLPLRAALLVAVFVHRVARFDPESPLHVMNQFFGAWPLMLLLCVPVLLAWRLLPGLAGETDEAGLPSPAAAPPPARGLVAAGLLALGAMALVWAREADLSGSRKPGRVMFVERHSNWSGTTRRFDTAWYGEKSGYNYYVIYDWLSRYYDTARLLESQKLDAQTLAACDVLVIKTPTDRYTAAEVAAVQEFVEQGGGLLLIGDHTNFACSATIFNDMTRKMGFTYRPDLLFGFGDSPYDQRYTAPGTPHPIVQRMPPLDFANSCTIDPGASRGCAAVLGTGVWSMGPEYHSSVNYFPVPQHCAEMRGGAFIQAWATTYGQGRVVAFTDSTIFSNFCLPQEGKAEIMFGMVEWLNHAAPWNFNPLLLVVGLVSGATGLWLARGWPGAWLPVVAAALCGWVLGGEALTAAQRAQLPPPAKQRDYCQVIVDRTISDAPLMKGPNPRGGERGFGLMEIAIQRLGYFVTRREGPAAFEGDVLVVIQPSRAVPAEYRDRLEQFVAEGGKLVVLDSADNAASTANSLLWPFGLAMVADEKIDGPLSVLGEWPGERIANGREIEGGEVVARLGERPVAALVHHGEGVVLAVGCASLWNDNNLGQHWMLEASAAVRTRHDVLFALLRRAVEDAPLALPPPADLPEPKEGLLGDEPPKTGEGKSAGFAK